MIGDLLAQISGEGGSKPSSPALPPKRKANTDISSNQTAKVPRTTATAPANNRGRDGSSAYTSGGAPRTSAPESRSSLTSRPALGTSRPSTTALGSASSSAIRRPAAASSSRPSLPSTTSSSRPPPSSNNANGSASSAPKSAPKKGSYLEIMERAKAAQSAMGQMGKIQHKPLDKVPTKRERMMANAEETSRAGITKKSSGLPPLGSARPRPGMTGRPGMAQRPLPNGKGSARDDQRNGGTARGSGPASAKPSGAAAASAPRRRSAGSAAAAAAKEEEKRPKKAATATTGYQGTARPRPTSSSSNTGPAGGLDRGGAGDGRSGGNSSRHRSAPRMPFANPRRSRYDEDDEMDDFIEYDDDEEEADMGGGGGGYSRGYGGGGGYGPRGRYDDEDEEDESDMEAGLSDIDDEETRAERLARREDAEQEALERRLKAEKEERRRKFMASSRR